MEKQKTYSSQKEIAEIWKLFRDSDRRIKETGQQIKAISKEADRRIKKLNELFTGQWGKLMEALVKGDLVSLLRERKINVEATLTNLKGEYDGEYAEFDIIAINGSEVVVVEVKTTLKLSYVDQFIRKLKRFKKWRPEYKNKKIYGAIAYLKSNQSSDDYAKKQKLFVIKATGSSASIINEKGFRPRIFS